MRPIRFEHTSAMSCSAGELWNFHALPDALEVLSPPGTRVVDPGAGLSNGSVVTLQLGWWPVTARWVALHAGVRPPIAFTDIALESPFRFWTHQHLLEPVSRDTTKLRDVVHVVPPRWLPRWIARPAIVGALRLLFGWRHRRTRAAVSRSRSGLDASPPASRHAPGDAR